MAENNWENLVEDIKNTIQDAIQSGNYDRLNQTISDTISQAAFLVNQTMSGKGRMTGERMGKNQNRHGAVQHRSSSRREDNRYEEREGQNRPYRTAASNRNRNSSLYQVRTQDKWMPVILVGCSILVGCIALIPMAFSFLKALFWWEMRRMAALAMGVAGIFILWMVSALFGLRGFLQIGRFRKYVKRIGEREYCNVTDLADAVRKPVQYVTKDIEKMIRKGWFLEGHMDRQKTCLITTNQMYQQYAALEDRKEKEQQELEKAEQREADLRKAMTPEVKRVMEQGDYYIRRLRECNEAIPGVEVSEKIARIETVVKKIFARVQQHTESVSDIHKLMEYYLPTTIKLLEAYAELDDQPAGPNVQNSKREIEDTLDTLHAAFEKLLDELFEDTAWDISTDISVLHTMLAQEGLKEDDWNQNKNQK